MVQESKAQVVYDIAQRIGEPGKSGIFFPRYRGSPLRNFVDYKQRGFVARLDGDQSLVLAAEISKQAGEDWMLLPLGRAIKEAHSNSRFKKMLEDYYWIYNDERILQEGFVQINNRAEAGDGRIIVKGERRVATVNGGSVTDTLVSADVLERSKEKVIDRGIYGFENGVASVGFYWSSDVGSFVAVAGGPSDWYGTGLAVFARVPKERKIKKQDIVSVDRKEYEELLDTARKT